MNVTGIIDQIARSILPQMPNNGMVLSRPLLSSGCRAANSVGISNITAIAREVAGQGVLGQGQEFGAIQPNGTPDHGQTITVVCSPFNIFPSPAYIFSEGGTFTGGPGYATGPVVGVARFQNGGADSDLVEFDVPLVGGTCFTLPTGTLGLSFRNDGALIPGFTEQTPPLSSVGNIGDSATLRCWAVYGTRAPSLLYKTQWFATVNGAGGLAIGASNLIMIPRYAKSFRVQWAPMNTAGVDVEIISSLGATIMGPYSLPAGTTLTPDFQLPDVGVYVQLTARTAIINRGYCIFSLGL